MKAFQPIVNDIQSLGKVTWESFGVTVDLNRLGGVLEQQDSSIFLSANLLRNQLRGLSEINVGDALHDRTLHHQHILRYSVVKDFSATGAARTFGFDIPNLLRTQLFLETGPSCFWERDHGNIDRHRAQKFMDPYKR